MCNFVARISSHKIFSSFGIVAHHEPRVQNDYCCVKTASMTPIPCQAGFGAVESG